MIPISLPRVQSIIRRLGDEFTTVDVLRAYVNHYHKDDGTPVQFSINAGFGRHLSRIREALRIVSVRDVNVRDDNHGRSRARLWRKS